MPFGFKGCCQVMLAALDVTSNRSGGSKGPGSVIKFKKQKKEITNNLWFLKAVSARCTYQMRLKKPQKELRSNKQPISLENIGPDIQGMNMALFSKASCSSSLIPTFLPPLLHPSSSCVSEVPYECCFMWRKSMAQYYCRLAVLAFGDVFLER